MDKKIKFSLSISPILRNNNNNYEKFKSRIFNRSILNSTKLDFLDLENLREMNDQLVSQNIFISKRLNKVISEYEYYVSKINENNLDHRNQNSNNINIFTFFYLII